MQIIAQYGDLGPKWFNVSLRVLIILAQNKNNLISSQILSEKTNTESSFIRKVLSKLVEEGLIEVKQGKYGGYRLILSSREINVADLYLLLSKEQYMKSKELIIFHSDKKISRMINEAENSFVNTLKRYTIDNLI